MTEKPVIGVTGPNRGGLIAWLMTALAIRRCGGRPVRITPAKRFDETKLDAIVIGGGTDVDPLQYGQLLQLPKKNKNRKKNSLLDWLIGLFLTVFRTLFALRFSQDFDPDRDEMEQHFIQYALYFSVPILGICRGAQLMNVALNGSLHQDIEHFYTEDTRNIRSILPRKTVSICSESQLYRILKRKTCQVNALHNQSIQEPGNNIIVSALEPSGVIQAIEHPEHLFFIGVQWHPEYIPQSNSQQNLFRTLVVRSQQKPQTSHEN